MIPTFIQRRAHEKVRAGWAAEKEGLEKNGPFLTGEARSVDVGFLVRVVHATKLDAFRRYMACVFPSMPASSLLWADKPVATLRCNPVESIHQARKQEEADLIRTAGISYKESLKAVTADGEGDKVLLPPSALESLSRQDAVGLGPMLFELTSTTAGEENASLPSGATTTRTSHAGVLEFVAEEGTVGLPRKVVLSLLGATAQQIPVGPGESSGDGEKASPAVEGLENVVVRYVRLAKATFARVVPETVGLSQVSELRAMLENNMRNHATLTVGDRLSVWRRGKEFSMKVRGDGVVEREGGNAFFWWWSRYSNDVYFFPSISFLSST